MVEGSVEGAKITGFGEKRNEGRRVKKKGNEGKGKGKERKEMKREQFMLFVSPDLSFFELPDAPPFTSLSSDFTFNRIPYRKLSPTYFAWLWSRVSILGELVDVGKAKVGDYRQALESFEPIYAWILERVGEEKMEKLRKMSEGFRGKSDYEPPRLGGATRVTNIN